MPLEDLTSGRSILTLIFMVGSGRLRPWQFCCKSTLGAEMGDAAEGFVQKALYKMKGQKSCRERSNSYAPSNWSKAGVYSLITRF